MPYMRGGAYGQTYPMHLRPSSVRDNRTGERVPVLNLRITVGKHSTEAGLTRAECIQLERESRHLDDGPAAG